MFQKRVPTHPRKPGDPGRPVATLGIGEQITMAVYLKSAKSRHEFTATVVAETTLAVRLLFKSGPASDPVEHFTWLPKSWELLPVPRCTGVRWMPNRKVEEIGLSKVLTFN